MGHTWIHPSLNGTNGMPLKDEFFNPRLVYSGDMDVLLRNMYASPCAHTDR